MSAVYSPLGLRYFVTAAEQTTTASLFSKEDTVLDQGTNTH